MKFQQGLSDCLGRESPNFAFVVKPHLAFGRMNIDIHGCRIDFEKQTADRKAALHEGRVVTFEQGKIQTPILHRPAVDKQMLVFPCGARHSWRADKAPEKGDAFDALRRHARARNRRSGDYRRPQLGAREGFDAHSIHGRRARP
jgi:hypothetical protein